MNILKIFVQKVQNPENMTLERGTHESELESEDIAESIQKDASNEVDAA